MSEIYVYGVRYMKINFFHMWTSNVRTVSFEKAIHSPLHCLCTFVKKIIKKPKTSCLYMCGLIYVLSVVFHLSICVPFANTIALQ